MSNSIRTFFLMAVLTVLFVLIGGYLGGKQGAFIALIVAAGMNFFAYWFSAKMVLKKYRAQEVTEADNSRLYRIVKSLAPKAGVPMPKVYIIPEKTPNAFATGRNPKNAAVAATEGILELLDDDELAGVMGHELAHVKHRDILTGTIAATLAGAIAMMGQFSRFGMGGSQRRQNPIGMILILVGAPLVAMLIRMAISRVREYSADSGGAEFSGKPLSLSSALLKLHQMAGKIPMQRGNPAHSHLFIVNPFFGGLKKMFSTHPPMEERVRRLKIIAEGRGS